jgi:hypothetical protein
MKNEEPSKNFRREKEMAGKNNPSWPAQVTCWPMKQKGL